MKLSKEEIKKIHRKLKYGDFRKIKERLKSEHNVDVSKSGITHVLKLRTYYDERIVNMAIDVLDAKKLK